MLEPGTLWTTARQCSERALEQGALEPIETESLVVEQQGIPFVVRTASSLARKPRRSDTRNPFLPPDEALLVGDVSATHLCVLNKFNVFPQHLLVVTRELVEQDELLERADFEALSFCLEERDAFAFYNAGRVAGASQRHRHLQLVPVPLGEGPEATPLDRAVDRDAVPYAHAMGEWSSDPSIAHARYLELLSRIDRDRPGAPYNLLVTRRWMIVVPRTREKWRDVSINALGFAGSILVKRPEQLEQVRQVGPVEVLREVSATEGTEIRQETAPAD